MLPLNIVFLVIICIIAVIFVTILVLNIKGITLEKILDFFHIYSSSYEFQDCVTIFINENSVDLDNFCNICKSIGKKIKKSCICFAVYTNEVSFSKCENKCQNIYDNKVLLIRYSLAEDLSFIIC
ncbi:MAG: hypothetical protein QXO40_02520 [Candidatus Aenigmatarchaeota archaeon]